MNLTLKQSNNTSLKLQREDVLSALKTKPGTTVVCEKGILWLTQSEDLQDYMLKPGEKMVINKRTNVLIQALSDAKLSIVHPN